LNLEADTSEPSLEGGGDRGLAGGCLFGTDTIAPYPAHVVSRLVSSKAARTLEEDDSHASIDMREVSVDCTDV
jgi:hypothetical protein